MHSTLPEVDAVDRSHLRDSRGRSFREVRPTLTPRWARVWLEIAAGYLAVAGTMVALAHLEHSHARALIPLWAVLGALVFGYAIAFVQLFFHEAAHFNVAPGRQLNDLVANAFIGLMVGQDIKAYRIVHFDHHRYLGTTSDTERSYFDALDGRFILEGLLGVKLLAVMNLRGARVEAAHTQGQRQSDVRHARMGASGRRRRMAILGAGAALNLGIIALSIVGGHWAIAVAWPLGLGSVHPFINATRQLLEHRDFEARRDVDYTKTPHGAVTRMFGSGPLASTLGGAGFNRHLLHHWEPQISYTRFVELEHFLLDTPSGPVFAAQATTYLRALARLLRAA